MTIANFYLSVVALQTLRHHFETASISTAVFGAYSVLASCLAVPYLLITLGPIRQLPSSYLVIFYLFYAGAFVLAAAWLRAKAPSPTARWALGITAGILSPLKWLASTTLSATTKATTTDDDIASPTHDWQAALTDFRTTIIREEMVPRTDMVALPLSATHAEIRNTIIAAGHSRIPIYEDTVDNIVGILHVKDLFRAATGPQHSLPEGVEALRAMLRATFFVPEIMKISDLLREFQRQKTHLAIVVDEYGGTAGLITLEDCIEQLVGEIQDEYDVEDNYYRILSDQRILADGRLNIYELGTLIDVAFPEDENYETLAGFLTVRTGLLPKTGESLHWEGHDFTVREADDRKVTMVEIKKSALAA